MNSPKQATPDHPIQPLIARRWSPYAFADRPVSDDDLRSLFEAARWAASSYNEQPWRYLVATKASPADFERLLSCLVEGNQVWAKAAPVLALGCVSLNFALNGKPNAAAEHDLGLASATLTLEATARGLSVHQMIGILPDKARELYRIPDGVQPLTGLAIGYAADPSGLPEKLRGRDLAPRTRRPLAEFVFGGQWGTASELAK
jgi:nitroreductase